MRSHFTRRFRTATPKSEKEIANGYQFVDGTYYRRNQRDWPAAANKMASLSIHVIVVGRDAQRGEKTVTEIRAAGGEADFISSNLRDARRERAKWPEKRSSWETDLSIF
jgi:hypothetical protein